MHSAPTMFGISYLLHISLGCKHPGGTHEWIVLVMGQATMMDVSRDLPVVRGLRVVVDANLDGSEACSSDMCLHTVVLRNTYTARSTNPAKREGAGHLTNTMTLPKETRYWRRENDPADFASLHENQL